MSQWTRFREMTREVHRGFIAEWTVTIILLLFATTSLVQAFVIPSASMEDSLLVGDHVLVDKLVYSPHGATMALPYRDVRRGDIIVFRYPLDIREDYVKRAIGVPHKHFFQGHGLGKIVELVAIGAGQVAAAHRNDMHQQRVARGSQPLGEHLELAQLAVRGEEFAANFLAGITRAQGTSCESAAQGVTRIMP